MLFVAVGGTETQDRRGREPPDQLHRPAISDEPRDGSRQPVKGRHRLPFFGEAACVAPATTAHPRATVVST
jgi:hypothetical protein